VSELVLAEEADGSFVASWNDETIARVRLDKTKAQVLAHDAPPRVGCEQLLDWLEGRGAETLHARSLLLRHAARQRGYTGALRAALRRRSDAPGDVVAQVNALLPDVTVELAPHGRLRGLVASLVSGVADMTRLRAEPSAPLPVVTALVPQRAELNTEAIARAFDMTYSVHRRFGAASAHVDTISFDHASHGMAAGKTAGEAARQLGVIHLNANYALARDLDPSWRAGVPASLPSPWASIDATTAHELWHKIELAWETEHYADSIEFRRAVGQLFGKETIEKVCTDTDAAAVLAQEVSAYAATNRLEATAEMFKYFWCGPAAPGSIPARFAEIVDRFFPA
jgi:hypothetical protein